LLRTNVELIVKGWEPAGLGELPFLKGDDVNRSRSVFQDDNNHRSCSDNKDIILIVNTLALVQQLQTCVQLIAARAIGSPSIVCAEMASAVRAGILLLAFARGDCRVMGKLIESEMGVRDRSLYSITIMWCFL
jgi:hypothetical protein